MNVISTKFGRIVKHQDHWRPGYRGDTVWQMTHRDMSFLKTLHMYMQRENDVKQAYHKFYI